MSCYLNVGYISNARLARSTLLVLRTAWLECACESYIKALGYRPRYMHRHFLDAERFCTKLYYTVGTTNCRGCHITEAWANTARARCHYSTARCYVALPSAIRTLEDKLFRTTQSHRCRCKLQQRPTCRCKVSERKSCLEYRHGPWCWCRCHC